VESNLGQQTPKLPKINVTNVSSAVFGKEGSALGKESNIGKLARIVRTTRIKVNTIEKILPEHQEVIGSTAKKTFTNAQKITSIKNILKNQKSKIGEKLPGSNKDNFNKTLIETNKILVEIQKQLASDFAMQVAEQKGDEQKEKKERSREKLKAEESALEKGRKKIGAALANTTKKVLSPFKGIFDQIKEFVLTVGAGIAVNAAFKWLSNEENRKKMEDAFSFIKENWKWIAGVAAALFLMGPIVSIISTIVSAATTLMGIGGFLFSVLGAPGFLSLLAIIGSVAALAFIANKVKTNMAGGEGFTQAYSSSRSMLEGGRFNEKGELLDKGGNIVKEKVTTIIPAQGDFLGSTTTEMQAVTYNDLLKGKAIGNPKPDGSQDMMTPAQLKGKYGVTDADIKNYSEFRTVFDRIEALKAEKNKKRQEIEKKYPKDNKSQAHKLFGDKFSFLSGRTAGTKKKYDAAMEKVEAEYNIKALQTPGLPGMKMGGPVRKGMPYIVGDEKGLDTAEVFVPEVNGVILSNAKTKALLASGSGKRGRIRTITLPPEIIEGAKAQTQMPLSIGEATKEPRISSTNPMDGSRAATSGIYGIMV